MTRMTVRKSAIAALAALTLGFGLAGPSSAQAHGFGWGGAGFGLGFGALAAGAAIAASNTGCYYQDRQWIDRYGRVHVRTVRVCY